MSQAIMMMATEKEILMALDSDVAEKKKKKKNRCATCCLSKVGAELASGAK